MAQQKISVLETPLYGKIYELYLLLHRLYPKIPKPKRYTIWQKCDDKVFELLEALIEAGHSREEKRYHFLLMMSKHLDLLKTFIRLAKETHTIQEKDYLSPQTLLQEIGKMVGGWMKSVPRKTL